MKNDLTDRGYTPEPLEDERGYAVKIEEFGHVVCFVPLQEPGFEQCWCMVYPNFYAFTEKQLPAAQQACLEYISRPAAGKLFYVLDNPEAEKPYCMLASVDLLCHSPTAFNKVFDAGVQRLKNTIRDFIHLYGQALPSVGESAHIAIEAAYPELFTEMVQRMHAMESQMTINPETGEPQLIN